MIYNENTIQHKIPYKDRLSLSKEEISALSHYKDLKNRQHKWDYKPVRGEKGDTSGMDCFMINSSMRHLLKNTITKHDKEQLDDLIELIHNAILSSKAALTFPLFRGLGNPDWLLNFKSGQTFTESAFGSFTTSKRTALKYAMKNKRGKLVFQTQIINKGQSALYIDSDESEWLLPCKITYKIIDIAPLEKRICGREGVVYYLSRIN